LDTLASTPNGAGELLMVAGDYPRLVWRRITSPKSIGGASNPWIVSFGPLNVTNFKSMLKMT
jgi:hypothetical protein